MNSSGLQLLSNSLLEQFLLQIDDDLQNKFNLLQESDLSIDTFSFYTSVSAVFSSKIEGENIELDSYIKHKRFGAHFLPDYTRKIDDLYNAYLFAQKNKISKAGIIKAHAIITKHILQKSQQGKFRKGNMYVIAKDGGIEYVAATPENVKSEMKIFFSDIELLLAADLNLEEVFFFASMIHLVFVKIHPFEDGNGRTARLLEKWFIAEKLGEKSWFIQSEKNYYDHHEKYYSNLRKLGLEYEKLNYTKALPFLMMLPPSIEIKQ